jgi:hypothetical protein
MLDATNHNWDLRFSTACRYTAHLVTKLGSVLGFATDRRISIPDRSVALAALK